MLLAAGKMSVQRYLQGIGALLHWPNVLLVVVSLCTGDGCCLGDMQIKWVTPNMLEART